MAEALAFVHFECQLSRICLLAASENWQKKKKYSVCLCRKMTNTGTDRSRVTAYWGISSRLPHSKLCLKMRFQAAVVHTLDRVLVNPQPGLCLQLPSTSTSDLLGHGQGERDIHWPCEFFPPMGSTVDQWGFMHPSSLVHIYPEPYYPCGFRSLELSNHLYDLPVLQF